MATFTEVVAIVGRYIPEASRNEKVEFGLFVHSRNFANPLEEVDMRHEAEQYKIGATK